MSSSGSSASSSSGHEVSTSPQPNRRRPGSTHGSSAHRQVDPEPGQMSSQNSAGHMGPPERVGSGYSRGSRASEVDERMWPDFLRDHTTTHSMDEDGAQSRRHSQTNVDRKRRLTNSANSSGRVRTVSGGFHSRNLSSQASQPHRSLSAGSGLPQIQRFDPTIHSSSRASANERALPPVPPIRRHSNNSQRPMSTTRELLLPEWQPDSEVSECPICSRQFTFWFRKHHCRKCGRVVCASCSPHQITIPRQFIVHPPESTNRTSTIAGSNPIVVDLTGDAGSSNLSDLPSSWSSPRRTSNPGLGGGEEVRLCNPCVPDPQPSLQATLDLAEFLRQGPGQGEMGRSLTQTQPSRSLHLDSDQPIPYGQRSASAQAREVRRQRGLGIIVCAG